MNKKGLIIINLGSPESYSVKDVKIYLRQFLMDENKDILYGINPIWDTDDIFYGINSIWNTDDILYGINPIWNTDDILYNQYN